MKIKYLLLTLISGTILGMNRHNSGELYEKLSVSPPQHVHHFHEPYNLELDDLGSTNLMRAIVNDDRTLIELLLAQTPFDLLAHQDNTKSTLFHYAAYFGNRRVIDHLLHLPQEYQLPLDQRNIDGDTAAELATERKHLVIARLLLNP